jgi:hypothetical protein
MDRSKRAKRFIVIGAIVVNIACALTIIDRAKPFDPVTDVFVLALMNGMFAGFFWLAGTYLGSSDLKDIAENKDNRTPPH